MRDAGIIDEDVDAVEAKELLEPGFHFRLVSHIAEVRRSNAANGGDVPAGFGRSRFIQVQNTNHRAVRREFQSNGLPDATAAARDHGDFTIQAESLRRVIAFGQSETPRFQGMKSS
jgi:hypothetical protein